MSASKFAVSVERNAIENANKLLDEQKINIEALNKNWSDIKRVVGRMESSLIPRTSSEKTKGSFAKLTLTEAESGYFPDKNGKVSIPERYPFIVHNANFSKFIKTVFKTSKGENVSKVVYHSCDLCEFYTGLPAEEHIMEYHLFEELECQFHNCLTSSEPFKKRSRFELLVHQQEFHKLFKMKE